MTRDPPQPPTGAPRPRAAGSAGRPAAEAAEARAARLAQALRANLARRKAHGRARAAAGTADPDRADSGGGGTADG